VAKNEQKLLKKILMAIFTSVTSFSTIELCHAAMVAYRLTIWVQEGKGHPG
jgi:hypothetical protein